MSKVQFEQDGPLGTVMLDNPPLNQIDDEVIADLGAVVGQLESADGLRVVLVRGNGDVFSAGADVKLFQGRGADSMRPMIDSFLDLGHRIEGLPVPTLAAVHSAAWRAGSSWPSSAISCGRRREPRSACPRPGWASFRWPAVSSASRRARVWAVPVRSRSEAGSSPPSNWSPGA
jgi:hypothetical protein